MVEILEQPAIRRQVRPMTVESYRRLSESEADTQPIELIRGVIIDKIDKMSRSQLHIRLIRRLYQMLLAGVENLEAFVIKEDPLTLADSEPEPDLAVVSGREQDYDFTRLTTALLAVEVAVTSLELDRVKASLYAEAKVPEYWIVLARRDAVEVYTEPVEGVYQRCRTFGRGETIACGVLPGLRVEVEALFGE